MSLLVGVVVLFLGLMIVGFLVSTTFALLGLVFTLFFAGLIGYAADQVIPGKLPYGWIGAVVAGMLGGLIGQMLLGRWGPHMFGIYPIQAFVGAVIVVGAAEIATRALGSGDRDRNRSLID